MLRIDLHTAKPLPDNPFISSTNPNEQRIYTYGHRNVQGVAVRPGTGQVFTAEHGPTFDDEVNRHTDRDQVSGLHYALRVANRWGEHTCQTSPPHSRLRLRTRPVEAHGAVGARRLRPEARPGTVPPPTP